MTVAAGEDAGAGRARNPASVARARHKAERAERRSKSRRRAVVWLKLVRGAVRWLPMPVACAAGDALGSVGWWLAGRARRQAIVHLALAMPELSASERARIGRRSFALFGRGLFAFLVSHRMGRERAVRRVRAEGAEHVRAALAEGKGLLFVTFHYGCFELLASCIGGEFGARAVGRESDEEGPTALLIEMRRELGCDTIQRGEAIEIIRTVKAGKPVALLIDQDTSDVHGAFVPFFGRLAHTPLGPAALAVRTGTPLMMGFIAWEGLTRHVGYAMPVLKPRTDLPTAEAVLELTARITRIGEEEIRKRPDHWVWAHRRWETRPEDHPEYAVYREESR